MVTVETYGPISRKNLVLSIEKFPFLVLARDAIMLQHLIVHFSLHYLSSGRLREVKKTRKFQTFRGLKFSDLTLKLLIFWKPGRSGDVVS